MPTGIQAEYMPTQSEIETQKRRLNAAKVNGSGHILPAVVDNLGGLIERLRAEEDDLGTKDKVIVLRLSPMVARRFSRLAHYCQMPPEELLARLVGHAIEQVNTL